MLRKTWNHVIAICSVHLIVSAMFGIIEQSKSIAQILVYLFFGVANLLLLWMKDELGFK